jgi:hypothetical protein
MRLALPLERRLERGPLRRFSVHYMATLRRNANGLAPARGDQARTLASAG